MFGFAKLDVMFRGASPEAVRLPYEEYVKPGVEFVRDTVVAIDPVRRHVTTTSGSLEADVLVVALGADYDLASTPGLSEADEFYSFAERDIAFVASTKVRALTAAPERFDPRGRRQAQAAFLGAHPAFVDTAILDELRATEYARLDDCDEVYLDYTGGGLYAEGQVREHLALLRETVYGNPHSVNPTSSAATALVERARAAVLRFFNAPRASTTASSRERDGRAAARRRGLPVRAGRPLRGDLRQPQLGQLDPRVRSCQGMRARRTSP